MDAKRYRYNVDVFNFHLNGMFYVLVSGRCGHIKRACETLGITEMLLNKIFPRFIFHRSL